LSDIALYSLVDKTDVSEELTISIMEAVHSFKTSVSNIPGYSAIPQETTVFVLVAVRI
jgi:hypothetical protein